MARQPLCSAPWSHLFVDVDGSIYLCCLVDRPQSDLLSDELLKFEAGKQELASRPLGHIRKQSLQEAWKSSELEEIRMNFLEQKFTQGQCWTCREGMRRGISESKQMLGFFNRDAPYDGVKKYYQSGPTSLDIRLTNLCNLKCIHCFGKYSSRHNNNQIIDPHADNELFVESFRALIPSLRYVNFAGGEPLLSEYLYQYLDMIILAASWTNVSYITNLTVLPLRLLERLPKISKNFFQVSLDGIGERYESIRVGASWSTVHRNFLELARNRAKYNIKAPIEIIMCIMEQNYEDFEGLLDLCLAEDARLRVNLVYSPHHLSPFRATVEARNRMHECFLDLRNRRKNELEKYCLNSELLFVFGSELRRTVSGRIPL